MNTSTEPICRPLQPGERGDALRLWYASFRCPDGYFERYFDVDPWHQPGDTFGAWIGGELASAVHMCRRPLRGEAGPLICGAIANVATAPAHRRHGLSRRLLRMAIEKMESEKFAFSALETGAFHHYEPLGWQSTPTPRFSLTLPTGDPPAPRPGIAPAGDPDRAHALYPHTPRFLQLERRPDYVRGWVEWNRRQSAATVLASTPAGYAVITLGDSAVPARVLEWRAGDAAAEASVLEDAVEFARMHGRHQIEFVALPQFASAARFESLGDVRRSTHAVLMLRNISLPADAFARIAGAYTDGTAAWWPADDY